MSRIKTYAEDTFGEDWSEKLEEKGILTDADKLRKEQHGN